MTNFHSNVVQIFLKLWTILKNINFLVKIALATFLGTFWGNWATFYSTMWSHAPNVSCRKYLDVDINETTAPPFQIMCCHKGFDCPVKKQAKLVSPDRVITAK